MEIMKKTEKGWECPVCGCGNAPWSTYCRVCEKRTKERPETESNKFRRVVGPPWRSPYGIEPDTMSSSDFPDYGIKTWVIY